MYLKKQDIGGLMIVLSIIAIVAVFFIFAPNAKLDYRPIEETGSSLVVTAPDIEHLGEIHVDATLKKSGFITFHEAIGQAPGAVVGTSGFLQAGEYKDLVIRLNIPLEADNQYFALMFKDNGNKSYDPGVDLPVMSDGQVIKIHISTPAL